MNLTQIDMLLRDLLGPATDLRGEYGFTSTTCEQITRLGYATNLTPQTVKGAIEHQIDLLITHHDAWDFVYGMRDSCCRELASNGIGHVFVHLPLDAALFGTAASLISEMGAVVTGDIAFEKGYACGRTAKFDHPMSIERLMEQLSVICQEEPQVWVNGPTEIKTVGVVTGGGSLTTYAKEAKDKDCDLYITGERSLYLVQYCMFVRMNLVICSHTFSELSGVRALATRIADLVPGIEAIKIPESHDELMPNKLV